MNADDLYLRQLSAQAKAVKAARPDYDQLGKRVRVYRRYSPERIVEMLGRDSWQEATEEERFRFGDRCRYELLQHLEEYCRDTGLATVDTSILAAEMTELRHKHGWE